MNTPGADPSNKLAATMLEIALAEIAEPERLRRGRQYARQGAVSDLVVAPQVVTGAVQGSRAVPYEVHVRVERTGAALRNPRRLADLVPKSRDLDFHCTCPDSESPCKHAVAVVTQLAERVAYDSTLLVTWRGLDGASGEGGEGDDGGDADIDIEIATPPASQPALDAELAAFLGAMPALGLPALSPLPHVTMSWDEPWSVMLHDALRVVGGAPHTR